MRYRSVLDDLFLRALVRDIVRGSLAAAVCASAACDDFPDIDSDFVTPTCSAQGWDGLGAIRPAEPFDAAALRAVPPGGQSFDRALAGTPCVRASDTPACDQAWTAAGVGDPAVGHNIRGMVTFREYVVVNRGDAVQTVGNDVELTAFLGAIDTPDEAILRMEWLDEPITCGSREDSSARAVQGGFEVVSVDGWTHRRLHFVREDGQVELIAEQELHRCDGCIPGRRPEGLRSHPHSHAEPLAGYFARAAHFEEASIAAFELLAEELRAHAAPEGLIDLARRFAEDERRHTARVGALARRFGGEPARALVTPGAARSLEAIALENAVEGCVHEAYAALCAAHQAQAARDPEIAEAMCVIAADEARHASLSYALHRWFVPQLSSAARSRIACAQRAAFAALRTEVVQPQAAELHELAGVPEPAHALRLIDALAGEALPG